MLLKLCDKTLIWRQEALSISQEYAKDILNAEVKKVHLNLTGLILLHSFFAV